LRNTSVKNERSSALDRGGVLGFIYSGTFLKQLYQVIRKFVLSSFLYIDRPVVILPLDTDLPVRIKLFPFLTENVRMTRKRRRAVRVLNQSRPLPSGVGLRSRLDGCCAEQRTLYRCLESNPVLSLSVIPQIAGNNFFISFLFSGGKN
jgi:hypothetical protein